jgi:hypothetical protein
MKKLIFILFLGALFFGAKAQSQGSQTTSWELTGNSGTSYRNFVGTTDSKPIIFKTNNTERMRLLEDNGFVGIGTELPQQKLHKETSEISFYKIVIL